MKEGFYRRGALFLTTDDASIYGDIPFSALRDKITGTFEYLFCDPYVCLLYTSASWDCPLR